MRTHFHWLAVGTFSAAIAVACPTDWSALPAELSHRALDGADRHVEASVTVPVPFAKVDALLGDPTAWPSWVGAGGDKPFLGDVRHDPETGKISAQVGGGANRMEGVVRVTRSGGACDVRTEMDGGTGLGSIAIAVRAAPAPDCAEACLVKVRAEWNVTTLGRMFGGGKPGLIALLPLALRDDLVAAVAADPAVLKAWTGVVTEQVGGRPVVRDVGAAAQDGKDGPLTPGDVVHAVRPARVRMPAEALAALERNASKWGKKGPSLGEFLEALLGALEGSRPYTACRLLAHRGERRVGVEIPAVAGSFGYDVRLAATEDGATLSAGLSMREPEGAKR